MQGAELRQLRKELHMTQEAFATTIGMSRKAISEMESGKAPITPRTALAAERIAAAAGKMGLRVSDPIERAARALCEYYGQFPDSEMAGGPAWRAHVPIVQLVLEAANSPVDQS